MLRLSLRYFVPLSIMVGLEAFQFQDSTSLRHIACAGDRRICALRSRIPFNSKFRSAYMSSSESDVEIPTPIVKKGPATLTKDTEWKLAFSFTGPPIDGQFGPGIMQMPFPRRGWIRATAVPAECTKDVQGSIIIEDSKYLTSAMAFWRLDEDPSAQGFDKAGFWIWGLFEEPKYPYFLFQMELSQDIPVSEGIVPKGTIYGQAKITRDKQKGVTLASGVVSLREPVKIKVDLLGLSDGILAEIQPCGTFECTPLS